MREFVEFIKTSPPAAGFEEVFYPGEIEYRTELKRREEGIYVEDQTWEGDNRPDGGGGGDGGTVGSP